MLALNDDAFEVSMVIGKMTVADLIERLKDEAPGTLFEKTALWRELSCDEAHQEVNQFVANAQSLITVARDLLITNEPPLLQLAGALSEHGAFISHLYLGSGKTQPTVAVNRDDSATLKDVLRALRTVYAKANFIRWATIWDDLAHMDLLENVERESVAIQILSETPAARHNRLAVEKYQASKSAAA